MRTRILLLRHAETSSPGRFHGAESDVGLGEHGRNQARWLAESLSDEGIVGVVSSGMRRAIETARPVAETLGVTTRVSPSLYERRMPSLSGRDKTEAWATYQATVDQWVAGDLDYRESPDDESYSEVRDRVVPAIEYLAAEYVGRTLLVVAHGLVIRVLLAELLPTLGPASFEGIGIDHCARNILILDDQGWRSEGLNLPIAGPLVS